MSQDPSKPRPSPSSTPADVMRHLALLADISDPAISALAARASITRHPSGTVLVAQGDAITELRILLEGAAEVAIDDQPFLVLRRRGDLIGEHALLEDRPAPTTLRAISDVEILAIAKEDLLTVLDQHEDLQLAIYRIIARILSDRLNESSRKAKDFESANQRLIQIRGDIEQLNRDLEAKVRARTQDLSLKSDELERRNHDLQTTNDELFAHRNQLAHLHEQSEHILQQVADIDRTMLPKMITGLAASLNTLDTASLADVLRSHLQDLRHLQDALHPITQRLNSREQARHRRVLLANTEGRAAAIARLALASTGLQVDLAHNIEEGLTFLSNHRYDILCITSEFLDLVSHARTSCPDAQVLLLTQDPPMEFLRHAEASQFVSNIVSYSGDDHAFLARNILSTVSKLLTSDIFGLEKYLAWGVDIRQHDVRGSRDRHNLISNMVEYLAGLGIGPQLVRRCLLVVEELLTNAIYDAPVDAEGRPLFAHLSRSTPVVLKPTQASVLRYACDGDILAISVMDPFGALGRRVVLDYLAACFRDETPRDHAHTKGGGGFGMYQTFHAADYLIFNVRQGVKSEAIALFNLRARAAPAAQRQDKSFHFFQQDPRKAG